MSQTLQTRLASLTFRNLLALCVEAKGSPLGFDPNRGPGNSWQGGNLKPKLAAWGIDNISNLKLLELLPKYESRSRYARQYVAQNKQGATVQAVRAGQAIDRTDEPDDEEARQAADDEEASKETPFVPMHYPAEETKPTTTQPAADEGATIKRVREIAREEAGQLDEGVKRAVSKVLADTMAASAAHFDKRLQELEKARPIIVTVTNGAESHSVTLPRQHCQFETLLKYCSARGRDGHRLNPWLAGPAGSGKSSAAVGVAKALNVPFYFTGAIKDEFKLFGFTDAQGKTVITQFRKAWEFGGVFLFDEIDGSDEAAVLALNAALANGMADFPDGTIYRHPDCIVIAAANTWGSGATHEYVGRTKLDAASKDRFIDLAWEYDEDLERDTSGNVEWARKVQQYRRNAVKAGVRCVISPRATYNGAAMLAAGIPEEQVLMATITAKLSAENVSKVIHGRAY